MSNDKNPWLALRTYQEEHTNIYKGREKESEEMFSQIKYNDYFLCYAASGDGKSSIINAGLCPKMREAGMFPIKILFTTDELEKEYNKSDIETLVWDKILSGIQTSLKGQATLWGINDLKFFNASYVTPNPDMSDDNSIPLWYKLRTYKLILEEGSAVKDYIPVIIFDQFEEIFRAKWKSNFFDWLQEISSEAYPESVLINKVIDCDIVPINKPFKFLFSMRYEYVGELDYWCSQRYFIPELMRNRYFLKPFSIEQAKTIIESQEQLSFASRKLTENEDQIINNITNNDKNAEVSSFIFSLLCYSLYEKWNINKDYVFHPTNTSELIINYYESILKKLKVKQSERKALEVALLSSSGNRRRMPMSEDHLKIFVDNSRQNIIYSLEVEHILRIINEGKKVDDGEGDNIYVEFIHDRLASAIHEKKTEQQKSSRRNFFRILILFIYVFLLWFTYHNEIAYTNHIVSQITHTFSNRIISSNDTTCLNHDDYVKKYIITSSSTISLSSCKNLKEISVEDTVKNIRIILNDCPSLTYIKIPTYVESIILKIRQCPTLFNINIPQNAILDSCDINSDILRINSANPRYKWHNYALWDMQEKKPLFIQTNTLSKYIAKSLIDAPTGIDTDIILHNQNQDSIEVCGKKYLDQEILDLRNTNDSIITVDGKFRKLKFLYLPRSTKEIESEAFNDCEFLEYVNFSDCPNLEQIGGCAFMSCENLQSIDLSKCSPKLDVGIMAFMYCTSAKCISLPSHMSLIGSNAFTYCNSIEELIMPDTIGGVLSDAFSYCRKLKKVILPKHVEISFGIAFPLCLNINEFVIRNHKKFHYLEDSTLVFNDKPIDFNKVKYSNSKVKDTTYIYSINDGNLYYRKSNTDEKILLNTSPQSYLVKARGFITCNRSVVIDNRNPNDSIFFIHPELHYSNNTHINDQYISPFYEPNNIKRIVVRAIDINNFKSLFKEIPDSLKPYISISVPYNCLQFYEYDSDLTGFKEITEESYFATWSYHFIYHIELGMSLVSHERYFTWMLYGAIFILIIFGYSIYAYDQRPRQSAKPTKLFSAIRTTSALYFSIVFWYIIYWFIFLSLPSPSTDSINLFQTLICAMIALVISAFSVSRLLYSKGHSIKDIKKDISNYIHNLPQIFLDAKEDVDSVVRFYALHKKARVITITVLSLLVVLFIGYKYYIKSKDNAEAYSYTIIKKTEQHTDNRVAVDILVNSLDSISYWKNEDFYKNLINKLSDRMDANFWGKINNKLCNYNSYSWYSDHIDFCNNESFVYVTGDTIHLLSLNKSINNSYIQRGRNSFFNGKIVISNDYVSDSIYISIPQTQQLYSYKLSDTLSGYHKANANTVVIPSDECFNIYNFRKGQFRKVTNTSIGKYKLFDISNNNDIYFFDRPKLVLLRYDIKNDLWKEPKTLTTIDAYISKFSLTRNSKYLYVVTNEKNTYFLNVWDTKSMKKIVKRDIPYESILLSDDARIFAANKNNTLEITILNEDFTYKIRHDVKDFSISPDGKSIIYITDDKIYKHDIIFNLVDFTNKVKGALKK